MTSLVHLLESESRADSSRSSSSSSRNSSSSSSRCPRGLKENVLKVCVETFLFCLFFVVVQISINYLNLT